jgi:hypothetical protein
VTIPLHRIEKRKRKKKIRRIPPLHLLLTTGTLKKLSKRYVLSMGSEKLN